jgi:methyl-accepting chemotaxis protein
MVEAIDSATGEQTRRNRQVIEAVSQIRHIAEANSGRAVELDQVVDALSLQAAELTREMGAFKA